MSSPPTFDISNGTRLSGLSQLVGNTPLLEILFEFRGKQRAIYAKSEQLNLTGSIKDRMALHILKRAYRSGQLHPGDTIAEATSGNTGISFAAIGRALGHPVNIFMPDWMSRERKDLIASYGAEIVPVSHEQGGFLGSIQLAEKFAASHRDVFLPCQFSNDANAEAHQTTTGPEIWLQLEAAGRVPDAFVAGVGTGGTVMGVGRFLRGKNAKISVHPVEPSESPTLSLGHKVGKHRIQGISDEFIPPIVDLAALDGIIAISDGDSILMAQKLASTLGLGVGISSGCNFLAAVKVQEMLGDAMVVTVFPDSNKKYLSTDLIRDEPIQDDYLAPGVELKSLSALPRVCALCGRGQ
ncbi:MAG: PLP-dependent cysteine synthase family protein [Terriglobales bacterium]|jgi:cysteine synthase A